MVSTQNKAGLLHSIAKNYVLKGLGEKNFDAIPYADNVELRAPLCPGGSSKPLYGKENIRQQWWAPLPSLLGKVTVLNTFVDREEKAVTVEFHCEIINPACTLRIIDRFTVNDMGEITAQENFFDPREITNPA